MSRTRWFLAVVLLFSLLGKGLSEEYSTQVETSEVHINVVPKSEEDTDLILQDYDDLDLTEKDTKDVSDNRKSKGCPSSEEYLNCGPTCQITCDTLGLTCPAGPCQRGCYCKLGKVRSVQSGRCISQKFCQSKLCRPVN